MVAATLGSARRGIPARGRAARRRVPQHAQRGDDARAEQDRVPGGDRRGVRAHRLLPVQHLLHEDHPWPTARIRGRHLEHVGGAPPRRFRLRRDAVQLHFHRGKPSHGARHHGQHGRLEARFERGLLGALHHAAARESRPSGRRHQHDPGAGLGRRRHGPHPSRPRRRALHRKPGGIPEHVADHRLEHQELPPVSKDRRRNRWEGFHLRSSDGRYSAARHRDGSRRLRIPGAEVLRRCARVHPAEPLAQGQKDAPRQRFRLSPWAT